VNRSVSWGEAALVAAVCWVVSGLGYGVIAALAEPQLSVASLVGLGLFQWFWVCHRSWLAGVAAGLAGVVVLFGLVDILRPELGRYVANALSTGPQRLLSWPCSRWWGVEGAARSECWAPGAGGQ
jgi:hypothetical protein